MSVLSTVTMEVEIVAFMKATTDTIPILISRVNASAVSHRSLYAESTISGRFPELLINRER